jgi:hypothetical protein
MELGYLLELRKNRQLHARVEDRIKELVREIPVQSYGLAESWGVAGSARADIVIHVRRRRIVHFELFGHSDTVDRDLRILFMSTADVKVALILDDGADPKVAESYFRAIPDRRFEWFWVSEFLGPDSETEAIRKLRELIEVAIKSGGPLTGATASLTPPSGAPFTKARLHILGFHPYSNFNAFWDPEGHTCVIGGGIDTDQSGAGECDVFIPDGRIAAYGSHIVRVVDSVGNIATTSFEVTEAWPAPYIRAIPSLVKPGDQLTVVGGGAPRNTKIMVHFWNGNQGDGRPELTSDEAGNFQCTIEVPWLVGIELVKTGRHRVSADAVRAGIPSFRVNAFLDIPDYMPPGFLQWKSGHSQSQDGICVLQPEFTIQADLVSIRLRIRNDRNSGIQLIQGSGPVIFESDKDLKYSEYTFQPIYIQDKPIAPREEAEVATQFRRRFPFLPKPLLFRARSVVLVLLFATAERQTVKMLFHETWPAEVWAEPPNAPPGSP